MSRHNGRDNLSRLGEGVEGRTNTMSDTEFSSRNNALRVGGIAVRFLDIEASQLKPTAVYLCNSENRTLHHTDEYENDKALIVRRGQTFDIKVTFDREFNPQHDVIVLQFVVGNRPQESKGTLIRVVAKDDLTTSGWGMKIKSSDGNTVCLTVMSSAEAFVGEYDLFVETRKKDSDAAGDKPEFRYKHDRQIIVLFNTWCEDDVVHMKNDAERQEYVMNDTGRIWVGSARSNYGIPWKFGQFEDSVLNASLYLLRVSEMATKARSDPVHVVRCISAMANSNDADSGILTGRWTKDYPADSTRPTSWTGSVKICEEFMATKRAVRYGQCWVFSGLVTSLCRTLGIPTRSVTNFESAHDTDCSMTIDKHFKEDGDSMGWLDDSVWNFHVWNESWFKRPDLPDGHDGWQAFDATPQETSGGVFCCGPASVNAVKSGDVYLPYDTTFVFGEVNGDRVYWTVHEDGSMDPYHIDEKAVGKKMSTKAVGNDTREDVTLHYKYPEGSAEERKVIKSANKYSSRADEHIYGNPNADVKFSFDFDDDIKIMQAFDVTVNMTNQSSEARRITVTMSAKPAYYTSIGAGNSFKKQQIKVDLEPAETGKAVFSIASKDYLDVIPAEGRIKICVKAEVKETQQTFAKEEMVELMKPPVTMEFSNTSPYVREEVEVKLSFENPLPVKLTDARFSLEGSYMRAMRGSGTVGLKEPVSPFGRAQASVTMWTYRAGARRITASFQSHELSGALGERTIDVQKREEDSANPGAFFVSF